MMKKIGIVTVYTGFNYGSSLQAYASKKYYEKLGFKSEILSYSNSLIKGRDVRIEKLLIMFLRTFWRPNLLKKTFFTYKKSLGKEITSESKKKFIDFYEKYLQPNKITKNEMKSYGKNKSVFAVICGSDQIWSATSVYVDPFYYLRYFPREKRIAYAPSFGKKEVPEYNKKIITKYLNEIDYLSVRELEGKKIIKDLVNKEVEVLIDPTLLLDKNEWKNIYGKKRIIEKEYILFYFLDTPKKDIIEKLKRISQILNKEVVVIPNLLNELKRINDKIISLDIGPLEFLNLVDNAEFICTDSFHGMLFSINFNKPFYVFERNYGVASKQSGRIISMLEILNLKNYFITENNKIDEIDLNLNWEEINIRLEKQREKSKKYLLNCFQKIGEKYAE